MNLAPVIGLETHIQLKTRSKLFCSCSAHSERAKPNQHICAICTGHPGTLPVPNEQAIRFAVRLSIALKGTVAEHSKFDRKNYFYPDLPKAYQISQYDLPIMTGGELAINVPGETNERRIRLERLHLEEDAAKNIHGNDGKTYVDYNRGGVALCEIVTRPDFRTAAQAKAYLHELRLLVRTLGVSDGDMERGHLRCDVNVSLREVDQDENPVTDVLNPKTEVKNINSFRAVERAIAYEIDRQTKLWMAGTPPMITTTRGWNEVTQSTEEMRVKESEADYRYFPEPDIPPLELKEIVEEETRTLPELPAAKRFRLTSEYGFKPSDAELLIEDPELVEFAERAMGELAAWLEAKPEIVPEEVPKARAKLVRLFSTWLLNKLLSLLTERGVDIRVMKISPENFAEFIMLLSDGRVTATKGVEILNIMLDSGADPSHVVEELGASRLDDVVALRNLIATVLADHPTEVVRFKNGETKLLQFLLGQVMRASQGNADSTLAGNIIRECLE